MARHSGGGAGVLVAGRHQNGVGVGRGARGARRHFGGAWSRRSPSVWLKS